MQQTAREPSYWELVDLATKLFDQAPNRNLYEVVSEVLKAVQQPQSYLKLVAFLQRNTTAYANTPPIILHGVISDPQTVARYRLGVSLIQRILWERPDIGEVDQERRGRTMRRWLDDAVRLNLEYMTLSSQGRGLEAIPSG